MALKESQRAALEHLRDHGATPGADYWRPLWAMEPPYGVLPGSVVDGRTFAGLVRSGHLARRPASDGRAMFQMTEAGARALADADGAGP